MFFKKRILTSREIDVTIYLVSLRGVAQFGSAPGLGPGGREFESLRPDHTRSRKSEIRSPNLLFSDL